MKRQRVFIWTGGRPIGPRGGRHLADAFPVFPAPAPLRRAALIEYSWGDAKFEIVSSACSVRLALWGDEAVTWLHCKAIQTAEMTPGQPARLMNVLIPVHYVTRIEPGPTFRLMQSGQPDEIGVFPPDQSTPAAALPLAEVERVLADLLLPQPPEAGRFDPVVHRSDGGPPQVG
jgi:hypothetical protein